MSEERIKQLEELGFEWVVLYLIVENMTLLFKLALPFWAVVRRGAGEIRKRSEETQECAMDVTATRNDLIE